MKTEEMRKHIREFVGRNPGTTGTAMIPALVDESWVPMETDFVDLLFQMVKEGELREEEYVHPAIPYRVKSRFYPGEKKQ